jgi:hypothetical protein
MPYSKRPYKLTSGGPVEIKRQICPLGRIKVTNVLNIRRPCRRNRRRFNNLRFTCVIFLARSTRFFSAISRQKAEHQRGKNKNDSPSSRAMSSFHALTKSNLIGLVLPLEWTQFGPLGTVYCSRADWELYTCRLFRGVLIGRGEF